MSDSRPLPPNWVSQFDSTHQTTFYVNTSTTPPTSSWIHPLDIKTEQYAAPTGAPPGGDYKSSYRSEQEVSFHPILLIDRPIFSPWSFLSLHFHVVVAMSKRLVDGGSQKRSRFTSSSSPFRISGRELDFERACSQPCFPLPFFPRPSHVASPSFNHLLTPRPASSFPSPSRTR
ncbi:hypothetical protein BDY24DRAFT_380026 [Mrakia frigida]|uniref:WW domain-containing protein n=1 Tax=Mrakia frigida TaxID=29902 RepID=UPI003FCBFDFA